MRKVVSLLIFTPFQATANAVVVAVLAIFFAVPDKFETKSRLGDFEGDTVYGGIGKVFMVK